MGKTRSKIIDNYNEKLTSESGEPRIIVCKNELTELIRQIVKEEFENIQAAQKLTCEKEILSVKEAAEFLNLAVTTLYEKTSLKLIPFHKRDKKLYFKKQELTEWLLGTKSEAVIMKLSIPGKISKVA